MTQLNVALAQINPILGDFEVNIAKILSAIERIRDKSHIIIFPELALTGKPPLDLLRRRDFFERAMSALEVLLERTSETDILILLGLPYYQKGSLFNSALLLHRGKILGAYHKRNLSEDIMFKEKRYFRGGERGCLLNFEGLFCEVTFFEDIFSQSANRLSTSSEVQVLIILDSSVYTINKYINKENLLKQRARESHLYVVYVNLVGGQDEYVFDGRSLVISPMGEILSRASAFEEDLLIISLPIELGGVSSNFSNMGKELGDSIDLIQVTLEGEVPLFSGRIEQSPEGEEEVYRALMLSLRDYVEKNGFRGVIFGLSGGIDSALVATLSVDALGKERVKALFMPSEFTSKESREDAQELAKNLGIELIEIPITNLFNLYRKEFEKYLGYIDFTIAEENLQARIRANILFYLSNREGYLVLSTSNKSESATGYGTIYGDIAGGFAPLKDVYKTWVYRLARFRNNISRVIPDRILTKPPSAELRPGQTDQDTLPPYELLDEILRLHLEEGLTPEEIFAMGFDQETVKKVMKMLKNAEYKRRQAPPGPKITMNTFGIDYRIPITSRFT